MADGADILDFNSTKMKAGIAADAINDAIDAGLIAERATQPPRQYLGASAIGASCERAIQYEFAGAPKEKDFEPRTLRKFAFGHMGEELLRGWLTAGGFTVAQTSARTGQPLGFSQLDGRFKGHVDGVITDGPQIAGMGYPCLWEAKSVGAKTFREINSKGLKRARPGYYAQVAIYQAYLGLTEHPAIFTVLNLDDGEILHLPIPFDAAEAQRMSDRAVRIVSSTDAHDLLPRAFNDPTHFECKWCAFAKRCWG